MKMKEAIILLLIIVMNQSIIAQNESCFEIDKIIPVRYEPSKSYKLSNSNTNEIVFRVDETRKPIILKKRLIKLFGKEKDSLTISDINKIEKATNKFRISYFANYTDSTIYIPRILNRITLIQEARDQNGIWKPIETSSNKLDCGNTDHGLYEIKSDEFIEIYLRKYCGDFKTKLRMKILTSNEVIVSQEYEGFINLNQFNLSSIDYPENKFFIDKSVKEEKKRIKYLEKEKKDGL